MDGNENKTKTGIDELIERIVDALNTDNAPEWNPAPSWADYVLTWEGLRALANDLLGRRPYDGRDPLAEPVLRGFLEAALNAEGYVVLPQSWTDDGNKHYGPLCRSCEREVRPAELGRADVAGESDCARCANPIPGSGRGVSIYVW